MSGSWFPVPKEGNRGTSSNTFRELGGNHWEPIGFEEEKKQPTRRIAR
jgi:hypothetical protein